MINLKIQLFGGRGRKSGLGTGGFMSNNIIQKRSSVKDGRINEKIFKDLNEWENAIRLSNVEILVVCNTKGNPVYAFSSGDNNKVNIQQSKYYEFESHIMTHNHPNDTTFSIEDLMTMITYGINEIRAVVSDGVFVFKKTNSNMGDFDVIDYLEQNISIQKRKFFSEMDEVYQLYYENKITPEELAKIEIKMHRKIYGEFYNKICKKYGYKYYFIRK